VFIEAKDDGGGGDNWTTGAISRARLQSNHHHQQTNIQFFTGRMPFLSPNQQCQSTERKLCALYDSDNYLQQGGCVFVALFVCIAGLRKNWSTDYRIIWWKGDILGLGL